MIGKYEQPADWQMVNYLLSVGPNSAHFYSNIFIKRLYLRIYRNYKPNDLQINFYFIFHEKSNVLVWIREAFSVIQRYVDHRGLKLATDSARMTIA